MNPVVKRLAIIGCGGRGIGTFGNLLRDRDDAAIVALHDTNPVRLEAAREHLGGTPKTYTDAAAMLKAEVPDAVIITTPDTFHAQYCLLALEAGCNLLVDKPLATTVKDCRKIIASAKATGKTVMIGFNMRQNQVLKRLKEIIDDGMLGNVFLIENREFYDGGRTYMARWNRHHHLSGGLWIHKGSHDFDTFNWLLGFPTPTRVSAVAGVNALNPQGVPFQLKDNVQPGPTCSECAYHAICPDVYPLDGSDLSRKMWGKEAQQIDAYAKNTCIYLSEKDVHDNGIAMVEYANGARASHLECFVCSFGDRLYTIVGDRGTAEVSLAERTIRVRPRWRRGETISFDIPPVHGGHGGADPMLVEAFMNVLKGQSPNASTAEEGLWATAIGQAAEIAWREKRMVEIAELDD